MAIVQAAEALFAANGIEGTSLRQIATASGAANTSAVAYHFGGKEGLLKAIFNHRLPAIDARRRELLEAARQDGCAGEVFHILKALWLPLLEQANADGVHSFAGFLAALAHSSMGGIRSTLDTEYPATTELGECLKRSLPAAARARFDSRVLITTLMITGALRLIDQSGGKLDAARVFDDTLRMASAAMSATTDTN